MLMAAASLGVNGVVRKEMSGVRGSDWSHGMYRWATFKSAEQCGRCSVASSPGLMDLLQEMPANVERVANDAEGSPPEMR